MVVLMVLVTVLNVLVAAALPAWSGVIQREKEEELIFRGLQYAEAIRVFQARFGRLPNRLEELVEVEPRSIRRLWEDPMTGEARWALIFQGAGAPIPGQPGEPQAGQPQQGQDLAGGGFPEDEPPVATNDPDQLVQGPISGVRSLAQGESMLEFQGKQRYSEWLFTVDVLQQQLNAGAPGGGANPIDPGGSGPRIPDLSSRWIGRPWPRELEQALQQGGMPGGVGVQPGGAPGEMPGGAAGQPTRRR
jgi:type II secretory pathway pseudopilin PulG